MFYQIVFSFLLVAYVLDTILVNMRTVRMLQNRYRM